MSEKNVKNAILEALKDLESEDFGDFRETLTDSEEQIRFRSSEVEGKSRHDIARLLVKRCEEAGALDRAIRVLRVLGCNHQAQKLESRCKPQLLKKLPSLSEPVPELGHIRDQTNCVVKFTPAPPKPRSAMSAKDILRRNKTSIQSILSADHTLILNKVYESRLITQREYNNLKGIRKENVEGHIIELVDTVMNKGDERCQHFLNLLETDNEMKETFPDLQSLELSQSRSLPAPVQETYVVDNSDDGAPGCKKTKMGELYPVNSNPRGICLILNNINFKEAKARHGTEKDTESLAEVFSWLGFTVLMCEDKTKDEMSDVLQCFSTLSDESKLKQFGLKEWDLGGFKDLTQTLQKHGDVFICCILSHGNTGVVYGTDEKVLSIKDITRTFKMSNNSPLNGKPKIFLIQACQGSKSVPVVSDNLETDEESSASVPEVADVLVAAATVEDYISIRDPLYGTWFIQSLCQELKEGCKRGDEIHSILLRVNSEVSQKKGFIKKHGPVRQMPEIRYTLRKELILSPVN